MKYSQQHNIYPMACYGLLFLSLFCGSLDCLGASLSTTDGLEIVLDDATGEIEEITADGITVPPITGVFGGLSFFEVEPATTGTLYYQAFESSTPQWNSAVMGDWDASIIYYTWFPSGGVDDSAYLRLGDGYTLGCGIAIPDPMPVIPGSLLGISWCGQAASTDNKYIFSIRVFDSDGNDITEETPAPAGWIYSAAGGYHCVFGMTNQEANTWETFNYQYLVPEGVSSITVSLRYWRDGDYYVNIDNLEIMVIGGIRFSPETAVQGIVQLDGGTGNYLQNVSLLTEQLEFEIRYIPCSDHVKVQCTIQDTSIPLRDRALRVLYTLPINAYGWTWEDDISTSRIINSAYDAYEHSFTMVGRNMSYYPYCSIHNNELGLSLAVPMDCPRVQKFQYALNKGLQTVFDIALCPETVILGPGKATFGFLIYHHSPEWGFRAATQKYYQLFPQYFTKTVSREGCWLYPIRPSQIPGLEDFGFAYFECSPLPADERAFCREKGIEIYHYVEPWGAWQPLGPLTYKPSYDERVATLERWAADLTTTSLWLRAPKWYTAQAVINSSYLDQSEKYHIDFSNYFWHQWGGTNWFQLWPVNPDPLLPSPNAGELQKTYGIDYRLDEADGIYLDSVIVGGSTFGNIESFRRQHFTTVYSPLSFSLSNGKPVVVSPMAQYDFIHRVSQYLHVQDKKVFANIFSSAYRFYAHLLDIVGSEVFNPVESDQYSNLRRTMCYQKPNTNLLQWFRGETYVTRAEIEQYIKGQTFYGFFPGVASCGGGTTGGLVPIRYFAYPELYERDRDLFRKYLPIIETLSQAGWEPITLAQTDNSQVRIERFGYWQLSNLYFTLRNESDYLINVNITVDLGALGATEDDIHDACVKDMLEGSVTIPRRDYVNKIIAWTITIEPEDVKVVKVLKGPTGVAGRRWSLLP